MALRTFLAHSSKFSLRLKPFGMPWLSRADHAVLLQGREVVGRQEVHALQAHLLDGLAELIQRDLAEAPLADGLLDAALQGSALLRGFGRRGRGSGPGLFGPVSAKAHGGQGRGAAGDLEQAATAEANQAPLVSGCAGGVMRHGHKTVLSGLES
jgi:hypothetical protein